jgi:hypothetical protein
LPGFPVLSIHICGLRLCFLVWTLLSMVTAFQPHSAPVIYAPDQRYRRSGSTVSSILRSIIGCMINIDAASTVSSSKKLITPERNALSDTTIEATECLKAWWDCSDPSRLGTAVTSRASTAPRHYPFAGQLNLIAPWPNKLKFLYLDSPVVLSTTSSVCADMGTLISSTRGPAKG